MMKTGLTIEDGPVEGQLWLYSTKVEVDDQAEMVSSLDEACLPLAFYIR